MTDIEIFVHISNDIADIRNSMFDVRDITIWMTKDLFNHLFPKKFVCLKDSEMPELFGCKVRVMISPYDGMWWIVGYEGKAEEGEV